MDRVAYLDRLRDRREPWDLVVIGGGATGLGAAVDASARGYRTLLLEARDFAQGTSSRSTKLIHGGVRYLARGDVSLVRSALRERSVLLRTAPHLVHTRRFLIPSYRWWEIPYYRLGMAAYDALAGSRGVGPSQAVTRDEALGLAPTLRSDGLRGGVTYHDGQFDDARLAIALARTCADLGGTPINHAPVVRLLKEGGRVAGVVTRDAETGAEFEVSARAVLNATGVFADEVRRLDDPTAPPMVRPSQGAHLVLDRSFLPGEVAILVPRTDDGRVLFAIPWLGRVLLGTTDTPIAGLPVEPRPLDEEVRFLLDHAARHLDRRPGPGDVLSRFAGLRPLLASGGAQRTAALSREHAALVAPSGLVTITGGKWTTYRLMAASAVDLAAEAGGLPRRPCPTLTLVLHGGDVPPGVGGPYGSDAPEVDRLCDGRPGWGDPLHDRLPYRVGEVAWSALRESARTVEDVLARRTRSLFLDARASLEAAPRVASLLAEALGFGPEWERSQVTSFRQVAAGYLPDGETPGG